MRLSFLEFSLLSLAGLFCLSGNSGQRCWYAMGSFTIQPSEFAKATALALAKYLSDTQINLKG
jgi:rod shape determining protein RodA